MVCLEGPHVPLAGGAPGPRGSLGRSHEGAKDSAVDVVWGAVTAARMMLWQARFMLTPVERPLLGWRATEARAPNAAAGPTGAIIDVISAEVLCGGDERRASLGGA